MQIYRLPRYLSIIKAYIQNVIKVICQKGAPLTARKHNSQQEMIVKLWELSHLLSIISDPSRLNLSS